MLWKQNDDKKNLAVFIQFGLSPKKHNTNFYYAGLGFNFTGLFSRQGNDVIGLAVAHDGLRGITGNETTLEFIYRLTIYSVLFLQPDIQYIVNPAGTGEQPDNCLAVSLRVGISL